MKSDDGEPPADRERGERPAQAALELAQLVVAEHAQRLERAGRRVLAGLARAHRVRDHLGELGGTREGAIAPRLDDRARHAARETLLAEGGDHFAYLVDARPSEPGRDRFAACR